MLQIFHPFFLFGIQCCLGSITSILFGFQFHGSLLARPVLHRTAFSSYGSLVRVPQFVGLFCVRGDERVQTALAPVDRIDLSAEDEAVLRQPRFMHGIDKASGGTGRPEDGVQGAALYGEDGVRLAAADSGPLDEGYVGGGS